jgi:hypothetical protein
MLSCRWCLADAACTQVNCQLSWPAQLWESTIQPLTHLAGGSHIFLDHVALKVIYPDGVAFTFANIKRAKVAISPAA